MLTAHGTIGSAVEAIKLGAFDYLTKPFTREQLRVILSKTFDVAALKQENRRLREVVAERFSFANMIAGSRAMHDVTDLASRVAHTETTVLLYGESGTGKELLAKAIHFHSDRSRHPFVVVNCAAIPESLLESELFGHRRGSFTGAVTDKQGKFEAANKGTIFLDEIGELPLLMQVKILRVLQNREIDKVGESRPAKIDVRIIAATNRDLEKMVADGGFRDDLYYRLAVVAHPHATTAGTHRRHPVVGGALRGQACRASGPTATDYQSRGLFRVQSVRVAREHPRTGERRRTSPGTRP